MLLVWPPPIGRHLSPISFPLYWSCALISLRCHSVSRLIQFHVSFKADMCTVDRSNFETQFESIRESIENASFVALDAEFTGLGTEIGEKPSLFDTPADRYAKVSGFARQFITCQIGISAFIFDRHNNKYFAHTYNFYICPKYFGFEDFRFSCQASSLQFLCKYGFDFNKFIYGGIPYLNLEQEARLRKRLRDSPLQSSDVDNLVYKNYVSDVTSLVANGKMGDEIILEIDSRMDVYTIQDELRRFFANIWTFDIDENHVTVKKVSPEERKGFAASSESLHEKIVERHCGFLRVIKLLIQHKKPIVGHNLLTDLILIYNQFIRPLPKKYRDFKLEVHKLFPVIFDTKFLSLELKQNDSLVQKLLLSSALYELYSSLHSRAGQQSILFAPAIQHASRFPAYEHEEVLHEAGYDAYISGYVFIRMVYRHAAQKLSEGGHIARTYSFPECLRQVQHFANKLHLMNAKTQFLNLDGDDPTSQRPPLLVVTNVDPQAPVNAEEVAEALSRFGSVEVVSRDSKRLLVAVSTRRGLQDILQHFNQHPTWKLNYDSRFTTSPMIWSGVALSGAVFCMLLAFGLAKH